MSDKKLIDAKEVSRITGFTRNRVYELTRRKVNPLPHIRIDGRIYYRLDGLERWLDALEVGAA